MTDIAIHVENLSKRYKIGARQKRYDTLRDQIADFRFSIFDRGMYIFNRKSEIENRKSDDTFWALKDVSFEVKRGEVVGIIGRNGAGKSTLLKILSRITKPTSGRARIYGRVGSLLEVGTGFHGELTGRENIYLSGAILGMRKREIDRKFDEIVAFAEIEKFIDTPVKRYSSGMYVRLAFAVAAHLEPEILLVDEVLAVGDAAFQKKCLGKMGDVAKEGRTVLFVSHNMGAVRQLCDRAIRMDAGHVVADDDVETVIAKYMAWASQGFVQTGIESEYLKIEQVILRDEGGNPKNVFSPGESVIVEIQFFAKCLIKKPNFWIGISSQFGPLFGASMLLDGHNPETIQGEGRLVCVFRKPLLLPQTYTVRVGVRANDGTRLLVKTAEVGFFTVTGSVQTLGLMGASADSFAGNTTPVLIPYEWHLPDGSQAFVTNAWVKS